MESRTLALSKFYLLILWLQLATMSDGQKLTLMPSKTEYHKFLGDTFYVACVTEGRNIQRVKWTNPKGDSITNLKEEDIHVEGQGSNGEPTEILNLMVGNLENKDRGVYTCSARIDGRDVKVSFELTVYKPIDFANTQPEQYLKEGENTTLKCNPGGDPAPKTSWKINGRPISFGRKQARNNQRHIQRHPTNKNWINVVNPTLADKGKYTCTAILVTKHISDVKHFNINVKVQHKPMSIAEIPKEFYGYVSGVSNLTCAALAEPTAKFYWMDKNNRQMRPSENVNIFNEGRRSYLQLKIVNESMFGDYTCRAQNSIGNMQRIVTLQKGTKPPTPNFRVRDVVGSEFRLTIVAVDKDREMPVTGYKVEYKKRGEDWGRARIREYKKGSKFILDGLLEQTNYVLRASSKNIAGYSDPSHEVKKKTKNYIKSQDYTDGSVCNTVQFSVLLVSIVAAFCSTVAGAS